MIRKSILVILTLLTFITLVAYVLSYTVKSKLECFAPGEEYIDGMLTKDLALLQVIGEFESIFTNNAHAKGLLVRLWKAEDGTRASFWAHDGAIAYIQIDPLAQGSKFVPVRSKRWAGFEIEDKFTTGPWVTSLQYDQMPLAGQRWCSESFCRAYTASMPLWFPVLVFGAYPFAVLVVAPFRRHRRRKRNECIHCGYNLTGLPEPRCPECGEGA
ncbi:MAG: hypothetical protein DHS20C16_23630 [Phycisphaerae bacterium]|nr:MAG: hypothetical protein DHS20C16_23630 [Phycisphaerae bacterium]